MGQQAGGNARFKGPGSLWKSSWKGRVALSDICCMEGFSDSIYYLNADGPLDISLVDGFFAGVLVGITELPSGPSLIARNGAVANQGWDLYAVDATSDPEEPRVGFIFTVYDGAGVAAQASLAVSLGESWGSLFSTVFIPLALTFALPGDTPNGEIGIGVLFSPQGVSPSAEAALASPYLNSDPELFVGGDGTDFLLSGICLSGLTGGDWPLTSSDPGSNASGLSASWYQDIRAAGGFVPITSAGPIVTTNAWSVSEGPGEAPDPLPDTVGSDDLTLAPGAPGPVATQCPSPFVLYPENLIFPYG